MPLCSKVEVKLQKNQKNLCEGISFSGGIPLAFSTFENFFTNGDFFFGAFLANSLSAYFTSFRETGEVKSHVQYKRAGIEKCLGKWAVIDNGLSISKANEYY